MTGVDISDDLATVREVLDNPDRFGREAHLSRRHGEEHEAFAALDRVEAELSRLREERDALAEALTAIRDCAKWYGEGERLPLEVHHALVVEVYAVADMALAGPDTPAEETT